MSDTQARLDPMTGMSHTTRELFDTIMNFRFNQVSLEKDIEDLRLALASKDRELDACNHTVRSQGETIDSLYEYIEKLKHSGEVASDSIVLEPDQRETGSSSNSELLRDDSGGERENIRGPLPDRYGAGVLVPGPYLLGGVQAYTTSPDGAFVIPE